MSKIKINCLVSLFIFLSISKGFSQNTKGWDQTLRNEFYASQKYFTTSDYKLNSAFKKKYLDLLNFQIEYTNCIKYKKRCSPSENASKDYWKKYNEPPTQNLLDIGSKISQADQKKLYAQVEMDFEYYQCQNDFNDCKRFQTLRNNYKLKYSENPELFDLAQALNQKRSQDNPIEKIKPKEVAKIETQLDQKISELVIKPVDVISDAEEKDINNCDWDSKALKPRLLSGSSCTGANKICFGKVKCDQGQSVYISCSSKYCTDSNLCFNNRSKKLNG